MDACPLLQWCKCSEAQVCLFCKILTVIGIVTISSLVGYFIGKIQKR